jgi:hypothetical protein
MPVKPDELLDELNAFENGLDAVTSRRDLMTATDAGARMNRLVSKIDRLEGELSETQQGLLSVAHDHIRAMVDCPRRMRLDNTWQDDFVDEARRAAAALRTLIEIGS